MTDQWSLEVCSWNLFCRNELQREVNDQMELLPLAVEGHELGRLKKKKHCVLENMLYTLWETVQDGLCRSVYMCGG